MNNTPYDQEYKDPFAANNSASDDNSMAHYETIFSEAETGRPQYEQIPDGTYQVNIEQVEFTNSKTSGKPMVKWTLRILAPQYRGRLLWKHAVFTDMGVRILKQDLCLCGLNVRSIAEMRENLHKLLDVKLEIRKTANGDFTNIYFNKRLDLGGDNPGYEATKQTQMERF